MSGDVMQAIPERLAEAGEDRGVILERHAANEVHASWLALVSSPCTFPFRNRACTAPAGGHTAGLHIRISSGIILIRCLARWWGGRGAAKVGVSTLPCEEFAGIYAEVDRPIPTAPHRVGPWESTSYGGKRCLTS